MRWSMSRPSSATSNGPRKAGAVLRRDCPRADLAVVATGGPDADERRYLDAIWTARPEVERRDGALSWPELAATIRDAAVFIGPDTAVTHLAAATGAPTVALYGPTDPRLWGPWPIGGTDPDWAAAGTIQTRRNVWLVQNPLPCLPCQQEGCLRRIDSHSQCLDELPVGQVLAGRRRRARGRRRSAARASLNADFCFARMSLRKTGFHFRRTCSNERHVPAVALQ